jgi:hypothetical protein
VWLNRTKTIQQSTKSNQDEGNDFENDEIQMEVCCPSGKEIPECDSESIEVNDMIGLLPNVLKSLEDNGSKKTFSDVPSKTCPKLRIRT